MKYFLSIVISIAVFGCNSSENNSSIKVEKLVQSTRSWDGNDLPNYPTEKPQITILKITIPPKTKLPLHKHPVINAGVLLKGNLTVITETNEVLHLKTGDPIMELVNEWHFGENEGDEPAVIVVFYAGTVNKPITVKKHAPLK